MCPKITKLVVELKSNLNLTPPHVASVPHCTVTWEPKENGMLNWEFPMRLHHKIDIKFRSVLSQGADFERKFDNSKITSGI